MVLGPKWEKKHCVFWFSGPPLGKPKTPPPKKKREKREREREQNLRLSLELCVFLFLLFSRDFLGFPRVVFGFVQKYDVHRMECTQKMPKKKKKKTGAVLPLVVVACETNFKNKEVRCYFSYFEICLQEGIYKNGICFVNFLVVLLSRELTTMGKKCRCSHVLIFYQERRNGSAWGGGG